MDESDLPAQFGEAVRALRKERGISQERLAALAGIDRAYMGGLERGQRNPSLTTMAKVASGLETPLSEVLGRMERG